jgi:putative peptidoglycan lipid II flippase
MNDVGLSLEKKQPAGFSKFFSAGSVIFFIALGQALNIIQEMLIAAYFGTTWITDAYKLSMAIPTMVITESITIISAVVIPVLYTGKTFEEQRKIFSALLMLFVIVSISLWLIILIFASPFIGIIAGGFSAEGRSLTVSLLTVTSSLVAFTILSTFAGNMLNSRNEFGLPALQKAFMFGAIIPFVMLGVSSLGIEAAAIGAVAGIGLFTVIVFWRLAHHHFVPVRGILWKNPAVRQCLLLASPLIVYALFNQVSVLYEKKISADFPSGTLSALDYALKSSVFFINFLGVGVSTVIFPVLSEKSIEGDTGTLRNYAERLLLFIIFLVTPFIVFLLVFRTEFIQVLFERGAFNHDATMLTSSMLGYYALGLLGHAVVMTFPRFFQATQKNTTIMRIGISTVCVNILALFFFPRLFGSRGIPLAFITTYMFQACVLLFRLHIFIKFRWSGIGRQTLRIAVPAAVFAVTLLGIHSTIDFSSLTSWTGRFSVLMGTCVLGGTIYFIVALSIRVDAAKEIFSRTFSMIQKIQKRDR